MEHHFDTELNELKQKLLAMASHAETAVNDAMSALDAFVSHDSAAARAVIPLDKQADALNKEINRALAKQMAEDGEAITRCLNLIIVSKSLERIADHATNVAEEVVYLCEALDIRHTPKMPIARP